MDHPFAIDPTKPYQGRQSAPVLKAMPSDLLNFMRLQDAKAFAYTAWWFNVYLLVRRLNRKSKDYIDNPDYLAKPADCKAKTAKAAFYCKEVGRDLALAGLVADPTLDTNKAGFGGKYGEVMDAWRAFVPHLSDVHDADGQFTRMYINGRYFVDRNPRSAFYGAVMLTPTGLVTAAKAIHGDYDLFGIVPADNPSINIALSEEHPASPAFRLGIDPEDLPAELRVPNCRGRKFTDVQNMLNRLMGKPMILHGSQEKYTTKIAEDETVDVFFPDGERAAVYRGPAAIRAFYETELKGRKLMTAGKPGSETHGDPLFGKWLRYG